MLSVEIAPMDKNPQDRISIRLHSKFQGFSNIIKFVVFLKRGTHSLNFNKMIYVTFFTLYAFIIMRKHICAGITYGIDVKSSNSALILKTLFDRLS